MKNKEIKNIDNMMLKERYPSIIKFKNLGITFKI